MTTAPEWTYRHADRLRNHWWWRPGWHQGTRFYAWHITFDGAEALHRLIDYWQFDLRQFVGLDVIPRRWLHLTMQGVGMVGDIPDDRRDAMVAAVRDRLAILPPVEVQFLRPVVRPEAIALPPMPVERVQQVRSAVRAGISDALGSEAVPESADGFQPHVSLAYVSRDQPAGPVVDSLDRCPDPEPVGLTLPDVSFIEMHRDYRMYEWRTLARVPIGSGNPSAA